MKKPTPAKLLLGAGSDPEDILYACGFSAPDPFWFLHQGRRKVLLVSPLEYSRAVRQTRGVTVLSTQTLNLPKGPPATLSALAVALVKKYRLREVAVSWKFPVSAARHLEQNKIRVQTAEGSLYPRREIKSAPEIAHITEAQKAAVYAMRRAVSLVRESTIGRNGILRFQHKILDAERVQYAIQTAVMEHNCLAEDPIVACGEQAADPHERGSGPLRAGETIVIDIFPRHRGHGYWGDLTRTVVRGPAAPALRSLYRAVQAAQGAALEKIKAGVRADTIHQEVKRVFEERNFHTVMGGGNPEGFFHGTGHGLGLNIHEQPSLGSRSVTLRAGNVVTVEPGLYYPGLGGVRIEDTVVVTRQGCHILVPLARTFEL